MKKILMISGHSGIGSFAASEKILAMLAARIPDAQVVRLDELYPDFKIDAKAEQQRLINAEIILLQFPVFFYLAPSIVQRWIECTFKWGFSHGPDGSKLKGKQVVLSFTTGSPAAVYTQDEGIGYDIEALLTSYKAGCKLCQMKFSGYVYTGGVSYIDDNSSAQLVAQHQMICQAHTERVIDLLKTL